MPRVDYGHDRPARPLGRGKPMTNWKLFLLIVLVIATVGMLFGCKFTGHTYNVTTPYGHWSSVCQEQNNGTEKVDSHKGHQIAAHCVKNGKVISRYAGRDN